MIDPFSKTRIRLNHQLETWHPLGILDAPMAAFFAKYISFQENIADEPFNRFADLSQLTAIHLDFIELADLAATRRASYHEGPPVKTAILAPGRAAYGVAHMFAALMEPSQIDVKVFRTVEEAASWLGVPVEMLKAEPSSDGGLP